MLPSLLDVMARDPRADRRSDTRPAIRTGLIAVALGLGGFLVWSFTAPLDQAVAGSGVVTVGSQRKAVQHVSGGRVAELAVSEGDTVADQQVLMRLDTRQTESDLEAARRRWLLARAALARIDALARGQTRFDEAAVLRPRSAALTLPADFAAEARGVVRAQQSLLAAQAAANRAELAGLDAERVRLEADIAGHRQQIRRRNEQIAILEEQLDAIRALVREGHYPRLRQLDLERVVAETQAELSRSESDVIRTERAVDELTIRRAGREREHARDRELERAELDKEQTELAARIQTLALAQSQAEIRAPVAGQVIGLTVHTVGGVIAPGARLMDIVPDEGELLVEARLPVDTAEKLHPGLPARLAFATTDRNRWPELDGTLLTVSADKLEDPRTGVPYILARVRIPASERARLPAQGSPLRPGAPVDVWVQLGERTFAQYLAAPIEQAFQRSLKE